jgi:hypothetical protein
VEDILNASDPLSRVSAPSAPAQERRSFSSTTSASSAASSSTRKSTTSTRRSENKVDSASVDDLLAMIENQKKKL